MFIEGMINRKTVVHSCAVGICALIFAAGIGKEAYRIRQNYAKVIINDQVVGYAKDKQVAAQIIEKSRNIVAERQELELEEVETEVAPANGEAKRADTLEQLEKNACEAYEEYVEASKQTAYEVTIGAENVILSSKEEVIHMVERALEPYDQDGRYQTEIIADGEALQLTFTKDPANAADNDSIELEHDISVQELEIPEGKIETGEEAYSKVSPYLIFVQTIEINEEVEIIPEEQVVENAKWTTERVEVTQEGVAGKKNITTLVTSRGSEEVSRTVLRETVVQEAVPTITERGTKAAAEYIKPLEGGRYSSGFGGRWGRMHKGIDWSCPSGTSVYASKNGVVSVSGEKNGYGLCIYINHPDGTQTRYAHNSKLLVSAGQSVKQGDEIARSGNTGRSTGPHVHFEILINGRQVNPAKYLK